MPGTVQSWELVEHLFDASVAPERLERLIATWDAQMEQAGGDRPRLSGLAGSAFAHQIAGVLQILEQLHAAELRRANDLLSSILCAAVVLTQDGAVVAANDSAARLFGLRPGGSIRALPLAKSDLDAFEARLGSVAAAGNTAGEGILQLRPTGLDHAVVVHLRAMRGDGSRRLVLAVTSELGWPRQVPATLARVFGLTPSEIEVVRQLTAGGTVAGIATASGRRAGTVRSQLHAVLQKTGTASQAELLRLVILLLQSTTADVAPQRPPAPAAAHQRFHRMPDGRRIEVLSFGDPAGRPVIWMQSTFGLWRLPRAAQVEMARLRLRVLVPFRAGWCGSDPLVQDDHRFDVAVADLQDLIRQLRIGPAVVVAPGDDIRIALMLAQAAPRRVHAIFGIGCGFPISTDAQNRRLMPVARVMRACARHSPAVLPFLVRGLRATIARYGLEPYMRGMLAQVPSDLRAFADPEIAAGSCDAAGQMFFGEGFSEATAADEFALFHSDWPEGLGEVTCPVTLIHGVRDGNAPFETALDYSNLYPSWRLLSWPDEGEFVAHVHWRAVLDLVAQAFAPTLPAAPRRSLPSV